MKPGSAAIAGSDIRLGAEDASSEEEARSQARERALAARLDSATMQEFRRARSSTWRRASNVEAPAWDFRIGWKISLLLNLLLLGGPLVLAVALPPVMDCRDREARFGFFAGETLQSCSILKIGQRLRRLDDRIKMLVRGSGR
jgi:hypothetical protein